MDFLSFDLTFAEMPASTEKSSLDMYISYIHLYKYTENLTHTLQKCLVYFNPSIIVSVAKNANCN